jgi:hypothetical protein
VSEKHEAQKEVERFESPKQRELQGARPRDEQNGVFDKEQVEQFDEAGDVAKYEGFTEHRTEAVEDLDLLTEADDRTGETSDPFQAAEEGQTYVPPVDPPVVPDDSIHDAAVASGPTGAAFDTPFDQDHRRETLAGGDELRSRVGHALRADGRTSNLVDQVTVEVAANGAVVLRGLVADLDDSDMLISVARAVAGYEQVIDRLDIGSARG